MASELSWRAGDTGSTVYCTIRAAARTYGNGSALETLAVANWGDYDIALTETPASVSMSLLIVLRSRLPSHHQ